MPFSPILFDILLSAEHKWKYLRRMNIWTFIAHLINIKRYVLYSQLLTNK